MDGFNLAYAVTPESFEDFVDLVVPELTRRGVYKTEYRPGTYREKLFGAGPHLAPPHPATRDPGRRVRGEIPCWQGTAMSGPRHRVRCELKSRALSETCGTPARQFPRRRTGNVSRPNSEALRPKREITGRAMSEPVITTTQCKDRSLPRDYGNFAVAPAEVDRTDATPQYLYVVGLYVAERDGARRKEPMNARPGDLVERGLVAPERASGIAPCRGAVLGGDHRRDGGADRPGRSGRSDRGAVRARAPPSCATAPTTARPDRRRAHSPLPGIVHRYPDRVLLKPILVCPVYCRFCFRRDQVGQGEGVLAPDALDRAFAYIEAHPEIWEVIVTGGDPFLLSPRRIAEIVRRLDAIPHVAVIRFHTRVPVVDPRRVRRRAGCGARRPRRRCMSWSTPIIRAN